MILIIVINNTVYLKLYKSSHELCFCIPQAQSCSFQHSYLLRTSVCLDETGLFKFPPPPNNNWLLQNVQMCDSASLHSVGSDTILSLFHSLPTNRTKTATLITLLKQSFCFQRREQQPPPKNVKKSLQPTQNSGCTSCLSVCTLRHAEFLNEQECVHKG